MNLNSYGQFIRTPWSYTYDEYEYKEDIDKVVLPVSKKRRN